MKYSYIQVLLTLCDFDLFAIIIPSFDFSHAHEKCKNVLIFSTSGNKAHHLPQTEILTVRGQPVGSYSVCANVDLAIVRSRDNGLNLILDL